MKKVIYIVFAVFALGMVSCSKQDVSPNSSPETIVPVWKSIETENANSSGNVDPNINTNGGITDPGENPILESAGN
ncbi:MAG: hypothetical protein COA38_06520 [Fluviicola sp.]|nr:MAG: hypothetical protein COA38_06520 [Fluviicola sp.]